MSKVPVDGSARKRGASKEELREELAQLREELAAERREHQVTKHKLWLANMMQRLEDGPLEDELFEESESEHIEPGPFPPGFEEPPVTDVLVLAYLELEIAAGRLKRGVSVQELVARLLQESRIRDFPLPRGEGEGFEAWRAYWEPRWSKAIPQWQGLRQQGRPPLDAPPYNPAQILHELLKDVKARSPETLLKDLRERRRKR